MVVFTCNNCGDSVQKPRVEKHYTTKCKGNAVNLTCVDCLKDFDESSQKLHIKCVTEKERYSAKGTVQAKPSTKMDKQEAIKTALLARLSKGTNLPATQKQMLEALISSNVPMHFIKFKNFFANRKIEKSEDHVQAVFELVMEEKEKLLPAAAAGKKRTSSGDAAAGDEPSTKKAKKNANANANANANVPNGKGKGKKTPPAVVANGKQKDKKNKKQKKGPAAPAPAAAGEVHGKKKPKKGKKGEAAKAPEVEQH